MKKICIFLLAFVYIGYGSFAQEHSKTEIAQQIIDIISNHIQSDPDDGDDCSSVVYDINVNKCSFAIVDECHGDTYKTNIIMNNLASFAFLKDSNGNEYIKMEGPSLCIRPRMLMGKQATDFSMIYLSLDEALKQQLTDALNEFIRAK